VFKDGVKKEEKKNSVAQFKKVMDDLYHQYKCYRKKVNFLIFNDFVRSYQVYIV